MNNSILIIKGESKKYKFKRTIKNGNIIKWIPDDLYITLKNNYYSENFIWQKKLSTNEITYNNQNNYYSFNINPGDTSMLSLGTYVIDISYKYNNVVKTIFVNEINIISDNYKYDEEKYKEIDWTKPMFQSFEYYEVDPKTWKDRNRINNIKSSSISMDLEAKSLGSASINIDDFIGECYIRIYMVAIQNGNTHKIPLGIFLIQTPSSEYDGLVRTVSMDAYTPLIELKEKQMPIGYSLMKDDNIIEKAYEIIKDNCRAPIVKTNSDKKLFNNFVSDIDDNCLTFVNDLLRKGNYRLDLDEMGKILFSPIQPVEKLQPVWTFNDDNSSILHPDIKLKHDLYAIPNKVEVIANINGEIYVASAINDDVSSPTSTYNRGRIILYRETSPNLPGLITKQQLDEYASNLLKNLSSIDYEISYTHGYCPVRIGDCIRLNYEKAGIKNIKAKIISQNIKCDVGCSVSETAVFTKKLWE